MKKLLVYMDDDFHESLKELAHRKRTTMSELVRYAVDLTFEDELDGIRADKAWAEYIADPSSAISLDDYLKERGIELPGRDSGANPKSTRRVADGRSSYHS